MLEGKTMGRDKENLQLWKKKNIKRYEFYLHKESDKDLYEYIEKIDNKRAYLIELIRKDMNGKQK